MVKVIIMVGPAGAGKSTYLKKHYPKAVVCSADNFHIVDGMSKHEAVKASFAHGQCLIQFIGALESAFDEEQKQADFDKANGAGSDQPITRLIAVDNTNTTIDQISPYIAVAKAFGCPTHVLVLDPDPAIAFLRNSHNVPLQQVVKMSFSLRDMLRTWPAYWPPFYYLIGSVDVSPVVLTTVPLLEREPDV